MPQNRYSGQGEQPTRENAAQRRVSHTRRTSQQHMRETRADAYSADRYSSSRSRSPRGVHSAEHSRNARAQRVLKAPPQRRGPDPKLFIIAGIVLITIIVVVLVRFVACSGSDVQQQQSTSSSIAVSSSSSAPAASSSSSSSASTTAASSGLTANEQNRTLVSDSANDVKPTERVCYLTFDDGPSEHTHQILDTLDKYGIKGTWFILGNTGHIDYVKDIWERGHQVGMHSVEHKYEWVYAAPENLVEDFDTIGNTIAEYTGGYKPTLVRFPGGSNNSYNAGRADIFKEAVIAQGWHYFDWNVSIGDSVQPPADPETLLENIKSEAEGCNSCCVLMHDSDFKPTTPDALPSVIEYFIDEGYTFDVLVADSYGYHF